MTMYHYHAIDKTLCKSLSKFSRPTQKRADRKNLSAQACDLSVAETFYAEKVDKTPFFLTLIQCFFN